MKKFTIKPLVLAVSVMTLPCTVYAQDTEESVEEVIVTGSFRESLSSALNVKRNSAGAVDSIVADDIASFPDNNLAESLQRISGVAITRVGGEGRNISVRGLSNQFTRVRINGMEAVATSGGTDAIGGANRGRGFDFNTFASELFNNVAVRKTASADVEEGSLGATVDMNTVKPFDLKEFTLVGSLKAGYNDFSEEVDPSGGFLVSSTFADDMLGALLSVSYSDRIIRDDGASTVRWDNVNDFGSYNGDTTLTNPSLIAINNGFRPRLPRYDSYLHDQQRIGVGTSLQFRPTDVTEISLDGLYSKLDATRNEIFMQAILNGGNNLSNPAGQTTAVSGAASSNTGAMNVLDYEIDSSNTVTYASFGNSTIRSENRFDELSTEFTQLTLTAKHEITDALQISGLIGTVESDFQNPIQTTVVAEKTGVNFSYDYRGSKRQDPLLIFGPEVESLTGWTTNSVRLRPLGAKNTYDAAQFDIEYDINDSMTLKGGVNYKVFDMSTFEFRRSSENSAGVSLTGLMMAYDSGMGTNGDWAIPDLKAIDAAYDIYSNTGVFAVSNTVAAAQAGEFSAEEETFGAYVQLEFETTIGEAPLRGDIGLRHYSTDQESTAWATIGTAQEITANHSYDDILPSINLVLEPKEDVLVRAAYSETIARAGLGSIIPNVSVVASGGSRTVSGGRPTLEPTRSKNYDLGVELYFDQEAMLGLTVFRKDIETQVQTRNISMNFTDTGLPAQAAVDACTAGPGYDPNGGCSEFAEWNVTAPYNGPGGNLYGFELTYQQPFTFLPGFWSNFGVIGNFTYVKAQLGYEDISGKVTTTRDLLGLSEDTSSLTVYYEVDDFSARVSTVTRAPYLTNAVGRNNNVTEGTNGTTNVDAVISYQLNDSIKFSLEALNLTDEVDDQYVDEAGNRLSYYHATGRQFYLGVQYKFQ